MKKSKQRERERVWVEWKEGGLETEKWQGDKNKTKEKERNTRDEGSRWIMSQREKNRAPR